MIRTVHLACTDLASCDLLAAGRKNAATLGARERRMSWETRRMEVRSARYWDRRRLLGRTCVFSLEDSIMMAYILIVLLLTFDKLVN